MRSLALAILFVVMTPAVSNAGPFCDEIRDSTPEKQGAWVLTIVDGMLANWPLHARYKRITSEAGVLEMFSDARRKIAAECMEGKDFAAGIALGEDLAIYKMSLMSISEGLKKAPAQ